MSLFHEELLLGEAGKTLRPLLDSVTQEVVGTRYSFTELDDFERLSQTEMAKIYWTEILFRAHLAAALSLLRHQRWLESCLVSCRDRGNYLGFCGALRGMTEAAGDSVDSLGGVPLTLSQNWSTIRSALAGKVTCFLISKELEDALIHFQFARKVRKGEREGAPASHKAKEPWEYIGKINLAGNGAVKLYSELCQVVHPASDSLLWMIHDHTKSQELSGGDDRQRITDLCLRHRDTIEWVQTATINTSLLLLKTLNFFPLRQLVTNSLLMLDMSPIPLWQRIQHEMRQQGLV